MITTKREREKERERYRERINNALQMIYDAANADAGLLFSNWNKWNICVSVIFVIIGSNV